MVNYAECSDAVIIRHKGEDTFYYPMEIKGHNDLCLYPVFPESEDEEIFIKFYDQKEDWEAFGIAEAQAIHRMSNAFTS
ncbi:MAG: hypothetical protein MJZ11_10735 [Lachnospiraceae bacterium]|nr:hypothetical protein [Lachnospiraceae bacterium]